MKKATDKQLLKLKELFNSTNEKNDQELIAIYSFFLQILNDIELTSEFSSAIKSKVTLFNLGKNKGTTKSEINELMKSAIDYYSNF